MGKDYDEKLKLIRDVSMSLDREIKLFTNEVIETILMRKNEDLIDEEKVDKIIENLQLIKIRLSKSFVEISLPEYFLDEGDISLATSMNQKEFLKLLKEIKLTFKMIEAYDLPPYKPSTLLYDGKASEVLKRISDLEDAILES